MKNRMLNAAIGACIIASVAQAVPTWPVSWTAVTVGGNNYVDPHYDEVPGDNRVTPPNDRTDLIGGTDHHGNTFGTAYYANDGVNLMFRVRITGDPTQGSSPYAWTAILNTDLTSTKAEYGMQLDLSSADNQVELVACDPALPGGPDNNWNVTYLGTPHTGAQESSATAKTDWYRFVNATTEDGSHFHSGSPDDDFFVDFAFDLDDVYAITGLSDLDQLQVAFSTSTSHTSTLKDIPEAGWSDTITVPEPTAMALLALGVTVLAMRRRKV